MRVRSLQMNDAHIYCTLDQFEEEFLAVCQMYLRYFELFGLENYLMRLSTHAPSGLGAKYVDDSRSVAPHRGHGARRHGTGRDQLRGSARRGRFLRPQDRRRSLERHRAAVYDRHQPSRFRRARPLRLDVHQCGGRRRDAHLHPPRATGHARALYRLFNRTLRWGIPSVVGTRASGSVAYCRAPRRVREASSISSFSPLESGPNSTQPARPSTSASAKRKRKRFPIC